MRPTIFDGGQVRRLLCFIALEKRQTVGQKMIAFDIDIFLPSRSHQSSLRYFVDTETW